MRSRNRGGNQEAQIWQEQSQRIARNLCGQIPTHVHPIRANSGRIKKRAWRTHPSRTWKGGHVLHGGDGLHYPVHHRADDVGVLDVLGADAIVPAEVPPVGAEAAAGELPEQDVVSRVGSVGLPHDGLHLRLCVVAQLDAQPAVA